MRTFDLLRILVALDSPWLLAAAGLFIAGEWGWAALLAVSSTLGLLWLLAMCRAARGN